jgi:hypothetical protein
MLAGQPEESSYLAHVMIEFRMNALVTGRDSPQSGSKALTYGWLIVRESPINRPDSCVGVEQTYR